MQLSQVLKGVLTEKEAKGRLLKIDPRNSSVGSDLTANDFIYGDTTALFAGPPLLEQARRFPQFVIPMGNTTTLGITEVKEYAPWREFGFNGERAVPGKTRYSINIDKILDNQKDLITSCYSWMVEVSKARSNQKMVFFRPPGAKVNASSTNTDQDLSAYGHVSDFGSELLNIPFGMLIVQLDSWNNIKVAGYAQICKIPQRSSSYSSNPVTAQQSQIMVTRIIPATGMKVGTPPKITYKLAAPTTQKVLDSIAVPKITQA